MKCIVGVVVVVVTLFTACGSEDGDLEANGGAAGHNEADVAFAQGMIPHHEQAVDMAELAEDRAESEQVKELATDIEAAQAPEIETMTGWLADWGEPVEGEGMDMGGTMSQGQMEDLAAASGAEFDQLFLEQMTEHHRGAIEMAERELEDGQFRDALDLAETIRDTQRQEFATMEALLQQVG